MNISRIARLRQRRRVAAVFYVVLELLALFAIVEGCMSRKSSNDLGRQRLLTQDLFATTTTGNNNEDVDVVGEGRRGDARGAALRLVDVAVSRGGTTLLSNIDWRVEPKSKWGLVVRSTQASYLVCMYA
jgi:hypothetical protein